MRGRENYCICNKVGCREIFKQRFCIGELWQGPRSTVTQKLIVQTGCSAVLDALPVCMDSILEGDAESRVCGVSRLRKHWAGALPMLGWSLVVPESGSISPHDVILCLLCSTVSLFQGPYFTMCIYHSLVSDLHWDIMQHHDIKHSK